MPTDMNDRGKAFESKWAHDAELRFKVEARRNRALGLWAAAQKGLTGQEAEMVLGKLVSVNSRQMVLEKAGGQVTFVRM